VDATHFGYFMGGFIGGTALIVAVSEALRREHGGIKLSRGGVMIFVLTVVLLGAIIGWATEAYVTFVQAAARIHTD
jgi:ABC-type Fe3+-siderophore transport system permease subunit